ncbi:MAG: hypothetical protein OXN89_12715, partial [Bryobacterales bacterium]|nr:hypothetical protein [Bryobacterales bacterium]
MMGGMSSEVRSLGTLHEPSQRTLDQALCGGGDMSLMMRDLPDALEDSLHVLPFGQIRRNEDSRNPVQSPMRSVAGRSSATPRTLLVRACLLVLAPKPFVLLIYGQTGP